MGSSQSSTSKKINIWIGLLGDKSYFKKPLNDTQFANACSFGIKMSAKVCMHGLHKNKQEVYLLQSQEAGPSVQLSDDSSLFHT